MSPEFELRAGANLTMIDSYLPGMMSVINSNVEPKDAIAQIKDAIAQIKDAIAQIEDPPHYINAFWDEEVLITSQIGMLRDRIVWQLGKRHAIAKFDFWTRVTQIKKM